MKPINDYDETVARPGGRMYDEPIIPEDEGRDGEYPEYDNLPHNPDFPTFSTTNPDFIKWCALDQKIDDTGMLSDGESNHYIRISNHYKIEMSNYQIEPVIKVGPLVMEELNHDGTSVELDNVISDYNEMDEAAVADLEDEMMYLDYKEWEELDDKARSFNAMPEGDQIRYIQLCEQFGKAVYATITVDDPGEHFPELHERYKDIEAAQPEFNPNVAQKFDNSKSCRPELIDPAFIKGVGRVLKFGADKYAAGNWAKGMEWSRMLGALDRHMLAFKSGEELDPETGECHLYHAGCMLAFMASHWERQLGTDDREEAGMLYRGPNKLTSTYNGKV